MKKFFPAVCAIIVLFCTACSREDIPPTTTEETTAATTVQETSTVPTTTAPIVYYEAPMVAVSMPLYAEETTQDGTKIFYYTHQDLSLIMSDPMVADKIHVDFLNRTDFENSAAKSILQSAQTDFSGKNDWTPYFYSIIYNPTRLDQSILSFYGTETSYHSGPRTASVNLSITYDLTTGNALSLREILLANYSAEDLSNLIVEALSPYADKELLFWDYKDIITEMFFTNTPVDSWFFTSDGLCFYFNPYEIGPYSTGTVLAEVPYEKLGTLLKETYFPAEQVDFIGKLITKNFEETDTTNYNQLAEVVLDEDGSRMLVATDGTLFKLRLEIGSWSDGSNAFTSVATVFATEAITVGNAVIIQAKPETLANLRLTYETEGVSVSQKIIP